MAKQETEHKSKEKQAANTGKTGNTTVLRKRIPVAQLLATGDPETAHLPKTWKEVIGFPMVIAVIFFLSLLTFHYAPHGNSRGRSHKLPERGAPVVEPVTVTKEPEPEPVQTESETESEL